MYVRLNGFNKLFYKAKEKINKEFGDNASYVFYRLEPDEVFDMALFNPTKLIEFYSKKYAKWQIIKEKLNI
ncbi:hypothetical protein ACFL1H_02910 [Nanoarchaeota archaeon]